MKAAPLGIWPFPFGVTVPSDDPEEAEDGREVIDGCCAKPRYGRGVAGVTVCVDAVEREEEDEEDEGAGDWLREGMDEREG